MDLKHLKFMNHPPSLSLETVALLKNPADSITTCGPSPAVLQKSAGLLSILCFPASQTVAMRILRIPGKNLSYPAENTVKPNSDIRNKNKNFLYYKIIHRQEQTLPYLCELLVRQLPVLQRNQVILPANCTIVDSFALRGLQHPQSLTAGTAANHFVLPLGDLFSNSFIEHESFLPLSEGRSVPGRLASDPTL